METLTTENQNPNSSASMPEKKGTQTRNRLKVMTAIVDDFKTLTPNDRLWVMNELADIVANVLPTEEGQ